MSGNDWPVDETIESYLKEKTHVMDQPWSKPKIKGLKKIENPILDSEAKSHFDKGELKNNLMVNVLSSECLTFDIEDVTELPEKYEIKNSLLFRSDLDDSTLNKPLDPHVKVSGIAAQFANRPDEFKNFQLNLRPEMKKYAWRYLMLDVDDISVAGSSVEPITCSVFVMDNKSVATQRWNFFPPYSKTYFDCKIHSQRAAIDVSELSENAQLVVVFYRIFQVDDGAACNTYYKKPNDSSLQKAKASITQTIQRLGNCFTPFAFSFVPLKGIQEDVKFPNALIPDKQLTSDYIAIQIDRVKGKLDSLPIQLTLKSKFSSYSHPSKIKEGYLPIRSIRPDVNHPILEFRHQAVINLGAAKFDFPMKVNARNIVAELSFSNGKNELSAIHNKWRTATPVQKAFSTVLYHEKSPIYDNEFIIDLPTDLQSSARIQINYYHAATQEKEEPLKLVASATLPLIEDESFISDGVHNILITYPKQNTQSKIQNSCQQIKTFLFSTIASQDPYLKPMYSIKKKIIPAVEPLSPSTFINYLFPILDSLIEGVTLNQPKSSVKGLILIGKLANNSIIDQDKLIQILNFYGSNFALRDEETRSIQFHGLLLKFWGEYIAADGPRNDIPVSSFLFLLVLKSIYVTKDNQFKEAFAPFINSLKAVSSNFAQANLEKANIFNSSFAKFIAVLADIGFYEFAGQLIMDYSGSFGNTENDLKALANFLDIAIHPKLFMAMSLAQDDFVAFFQNLMNLAIDTPPTSEIQNIYRIFARLLLFVPQEDRSHLASKYLCLLSTFAEKDIKNQNESLQFLLSIISFIYKYAEHADFKSFYEKVDHKKFNKLLHFSLTKSRVTFERKQPQTSEKGGLEEAMSFARTKSKKRLFGSSQFLIPVTSDAVRESLIIESMGSTDTHQPPQIRELALDMQLSVIYVVNHILEISLPDASFCVLDMIYHILSINICIDSTRKIKELIFLFIEKHFVALLNSHEPPFPLFLAKLLSLIAVKNYAVSDELASIFPRLSSAEIRAFPTNNRTHVSAIRAISKMRDEDIESPILLQALESRSDNGGTVDKIVECIKTISELNKDMRQIDPEHFHELRKCQVVKEASKNETNIEKYGDDILLRSKAYAASPDACREEISYLVQYHYRNSYMSESMMATIYEIALVVEYLTILKRIPDSYGMEHPALAFKDTCNDAVDHVCPDEIMKDLPIIPGYCDSSMFSDAGLAIMLQDLQDMCKKANLFEISNEVKLLTYPLYEKRHLLRELASQFGKSSMNYQVMKVLSSNTDRLLGRYYRIAFYGKIFGTDDGKMYVQRETKLAHLFDVTNRIKNTYINLYGADKIEILTQSGFIDRNLLDPEKGYIQLTFVEPFFEKKELEKRVTVFECSNKLSMFKFETPFVKGEKKLQGSVESQWQRRTILKVKAVMPAVTKRIEVPPEGYIVVEYEPIRVSIRQIKERIQQYEAAIAKNDYQAIQPLLHGSLLVQVNEGPTKMAEVFLGTNLRTKYTEKMRGLFQKFLELNAQGLAIHGAFFRTNPGFQELQNQLEEGFRNLTQKLSPYLNLPK